MQSSVSGRNGSVADARYIYCAVSEEIAVRLFKPERSSHRLGDDDLEQHQRQQRQDDDLWRSFAASVSTVSSTTRETSAVALSGEQVPLAAQLATTAGDSSGFLVILSSLVQSHTPTHRTLVTCNSSWVECNCRHRFRTKTLILGYDFRLREIFERPSRRNLQSASSSK